MPPDSWTAFNRSRLQYQNTCRRNRHEPSNLYKRIKSISGQSANSFIRFIRLRKAAEILLTTDSTVYETAYKVGLNDLKYFREQFNKLFGINPSDYIKKYRKPFHNNYNVNRDVIKENW